MGPHPRWREGGPGEYRFAPTRASRLRLTVGQVRSGHPFHWTVAELRVLTPGEPAPLRQAAPEILALLGSQPPAKILTTDFWGAGLWVASKAGWPARWPTPRPIAAPAAATAAGPGRASRPAYGPGPGTGFVLPPALAARPGGAPGRPGLTASPPEPGRPGLPARRGGRPAPPAPLPGLARQGRGPGDRPGLGRRCPLHPRPAPIPGAGGGSGPGRRSRPGRAGFGKRPPSGRLPPRPAGPGRPGGGRMGRGAGGLRLVPNVVERPGAPGLPAGGTRVVWPARPVARLRLELTAPHSEKWWSLTRLVLLAPAAE